MSYLGIFENGEMKEINELSPHLLQNAADGYLQVIRFSENRFCFEELVVGAELDHYWKRIEK